MSVFSDIVEDVAPWITSAITGGPLGIAVMAATKAAGALGITSDGGAKDIVREVRDVLAGPVTPEQKLALKTAEQSFAGEMQKLGYQHETDMLEIDKAALLAVNETFRTELANSAQETWYQKGWRPANGFCLALGSFVSVVAVCLLFYRALVLKDLTALAAIPQLAEAISLILAVPGAAVGIASWHRGKEKRGK